MIKIIERSVPIQSGVFDRAEADKHIRLRQFLPEFADDIPWLEHVWSLQWSIEKGCEFSQKTVPYPAFNLVSDHTRGSALFGCISGCFEYPLTGKGQVVGFRLKPASQGVWWQGDAVDLTDSQMPVGEIFDANLCEGLGALAGEVLDIDQISVVLSQLQQWAKPQDPEAIKVSAMADYIAQNRQVFRAGDLATAFQLSERSVQRLFRAHLGLSPKLVIDRCRMHEALDALHGEQQLDLAQLAVRLNYSDQAHFSNMFRKLTGVSPGSYRARNATRA